MKTHGALKHSQTNVDAGFNHPDSLFIEPSFDALVLAVFWPPQ